MELFCYGIARKLCFFAIAVGASWSLLHHGASTKEFDAPRSFDVIDTPQGIYICYCCLIMEATSYGSPMILEIVLFRGANTNVSAANAVRCHQWDAKCTIFTVMGPLDLAVMGPLNAHALNAGVGLLWTANSSACEQCGNSGGLDFFLKEEIGDEDVRRRATTSESDICLSPAKFGGTDQRLQVQATVWSCRGFGSGADRKAKSGVALFLV
ncbi:hypothetical protein U1Q18_023134 [Sarracenia purpurea var. burkii]